MAPRLTVLLPTHNRADVLGYAIRSVLWQTEGDFELLVVGDGCTDETADVVAGFADARIRWFDLPKAPLSGYANRNVALRQARGRYIAYAQHDDILFPDHLERLVGALEAASAEWAYSRPLWVFPDGFLLPFAVNLTGSDESHHFLSRENHIPSNCVLHTRSALERVGFWPVDVARIADWRCWQRILATGCGRIGFCRDPTGLHFRARWRTEPVPGEMEMREIAAGDWWPPACHVALPAGMTEQEALFTAMEAAPAEWVAEVRTAVALIIDRLAWSWIVPNVRKWPLDDPGYRQLRGDAPSLGEAHAALLRDHAHLTNELERLGTIERAHEELASNWRSAWALVRQLVRVVRERLGGAKAPSKQGPERR